MLKFCFAIIGLSLIIALVPLTIASSAQHRPIAEDIFSSTSNGDNFKGAEEVNTGEYTLGTALMARQDEPDPLPPPRTPPK